jgi:hypothetical protein
VEQTIDEVSSHKSLDLCNFTLTRSSYLMFGSTPPYFSDGHADPEFELRLLDKRQAVIEDNASAVVNAALARPQPSFQVHPPGEMTTDGTHDYLLKFNIPAKAPGSIVVRSNTLDQAYFLPDSGSSRAFGSDSQSSRTLAIRVAGKPIESVSIAASPDRVSVQAIPFNEAMLPIKLKNLIPLVADIDSPVAGFLETPRVFIPGYRGTVNGVLTSLVCSAAGLVAVPISAGHQHVVVDYPGSMILKLLYFTSMASFAVALAGVAWIVLRGLGPIGAPAPLDSKAVERYRLFAPRGKSAIN